MSPHNAQKTPSKSHSTHSRKRTISPPQSSRSQKKIRSPPQSVVSPKPSKSNTYEKSSRTNLLNSDPYSAEHGQNLVAQAQQSIQGGKATKEKDGADGEGEDKDIDEVGDLPGEVQLGGALDLSPQSPLTSPDDPELFMVGGSRSRSVSWGHVFSQRRLCGSAFSSDSSAFTVSSFPTSAVDDDASVDNLMVLAGAEIGATHG